ncbi:MAG: TolC family protein [Planctomycetaceae bacterium]
MASTGCHIPGLRGALPGAALPADFNGTTTAENSAELGVAEFYQDPLLTSLVAQSLSGNQELRLLEQDIEIAANDVLARRGAYLPFAALGGNAGVGTESLFTPLGAAEKVLEFRPGQHFPEPTPNFRVTTDVWWQLDIWRQLRNARDAAIQRQIAAVERRNAFVTRMVAEIAENYYELLALDQRLLILDQIIAVQEKSLAAAEANREAGRSTELPVQRFQAEVHKNQSEKLIVRQEIIQAENRINFLRGTFPQPVERSPANIIDLELQAVQVGFPPQLLQYRPDIRAAERELAATGLDVQVARANFFPKLALTGTVGFEAFNPRYFFDPEALVGNIAGNLVQPLINWNAIQADYLNANARQLQAVYNYQRTVLNAFTDVVNNLAKAENYRQSVEIKKLQLDALVKSVDVATSLFQSNRADYVDVLFSQRDLRDARTIVVDTKLQQLTAIVRAFQAIGGGVILSLQNPLGFEMMTPQPDPGPMLPPAEEGADGAPGADAQPKADGQQGASSEGETAGRATISAIIDKAIVPEAGGRAELDEHLSGPPIRQVSTFRPGAGIDDLFGVETTVANQESRPFPDRTGNDAADKVGQEVDQAPTAKNLNLRSDAAGLGGLLRDNTSRQAHLPAIGLDK